MKEVLISFETAKLTKEKGFNEECLCYYFEDGEFREHKIEDTYGYYGEEYTVEYEELLRNWNDNFLTKKDGNRCFGCAKLRGYLETYSAPTQVLLAKWLREVHNLFIKIDFFTDNEVDKLTYDYCISNLSHPFKENEINEDYVIDYSMTRNFKTYEQALEEGLFEALKLIKDDTN